MVKVEKDQGQVSGNGSFGEVLPNHNGHGQGEDASILMDASLVMATLDGEDLTETKEASAIFIPEEHDFLKTREGQYLMQQLREELRAELMRDFERVVDERVREIMSHTRHDLRTPITNLSTRTYLARKALQELPLSTLDKEGVERLSHHISVIEASVKTFAAALDLDTTNIYEVRLKRMSSGQILEHLMNRYRQSGLLNDKVSLAWLFPDQDTQFIGDDDKIKSMLHILIDNALKFTPRGTIHIKLAVTQDHIVIDVADTGCGIPKKKLATIFEEGVSLSHDETPAIPGSPQSTGLGLYYVKRFCEVLGGHVRVESDYGYRTMFTITLPRHSEADLHA